MERAKLSCLEQGTPAVDNELFRGASMIENQLRTIVQSAIDQIGEPGLSIRGIDKTDLGWMILFWVRTDTDTTGHELSYSFG